jgi:hypothetical protein
MLSTKLMSHITLTMTIEAAGGGEDFWEICCPIVTGDKNL